MNTLEQGRILATSNGTSKFLLWTKHSALSGNYHRNIDGIQSNIRAFTAVPEEARGYLKKNQINYVHVCRTTQESVVLEEQNPDGLMGVLLEETPPDYLSVLSDLEDGAVTIYRFNPRRNFRGE